MKRRTFLAAAALPFWTAALDAKGKPRLATRVVDRLRPVSQQRRDALALNAEKKAPLDLNRLIPEIDEIEVWNGAPGKSLRVVAWNMERGRHWEGGARLIRETESLRDPDILLMGEMDHGMARSGNAHTTRKLAEALGMNYAYGVEFLELTGGELEERKLYPGANEWGYHGNAILSRYPLRNVRMLRFAGIEKWYAGVGANDGERVQKRLGGRMALFATVGVGRDVTVVVTHLESSAKDSAARKVQTALMLDALRDYAKNTPVILGGDLNATPDEEMFVAVRAAGFCPDESNELSVGTRQKVGEDGKVAVLENHIDYVLARGLPVVRDHTSPRVVPAVYPPGPDGQMLGDHAIVTAKVALPRT